jgi:predicted nucleic acid-binding protein
VPCYDSRIISEYKDVLLRPKFGFKKIEVEALVEFIQQIGLLTAAIPCDTQITDPDDVPFAEIAACAQAEYLITGNTAHIPEGIGQSKVVSPTVFVKLFAG